MDMRNAYEGRSRAELKPLRRDLLATRESHLREAQRLLAESHRIGRVLGQADRRNLCVSDHAVVRWLERVEGMDIEAVRERMKQVVNYAPVGDEALVYHGAHVLVIRESQITTVMPTGAAPPPDAAQEGER